MVKIVYGDGSAHKRAVYHTYFKVPDPNKKFITQYSLVEVALK
jgi:hypothetical protein